LKLFAYDTLALEEFVHFTVLATFCLIVSWTVLRAWIDAEALVSLLAQTFSDVSLLCILEIDVNVYTQADVFVNVSTYVEMVVKASTVTETGTIT